jgi:DNA-binding MarR family transcriptional regulator
VVPPPEPESPLIGALLRVPWQVLRHRILAGLHAHGFTDLNAVHLSVLQHPGPHDQRPSELAVQTHMSKQALNYLLGQMERLGYLERRDDPRDHRYKRIHLTRRGHRAMRTTREIVLEVEAEWARQMGLHRFAELSELLDELNSVATRSAPSADPSA